MCYFCLLQRIFILLNGKPAIHYHIVNRRVRALEERGYIEKCGERRTRTGFAAMLYQLTTRAYLATLLDKIELDNFIETAPDANIISVIEAIISARIS